jgi:hypothetical protein
MTTVGKTSLGCVVAGFLALALSSGTAAGPAPAAPAPSLDQSLTQAMDKNPNIVAARARVAMAEAELKNAQHEVAWKVVVCWNGLKEQEVAAATARDRLKLVQGSHNEGTVPAQEVTAAKSALIDAEARLERSRSELEFLIGRAPPAVSRSLAASPGLDVSRPPLQIPRGPMVDNIRRALNDPSQVEFVETPLSDVLDYLKDKHRIEIQLDSASLGKVGVTADCPITMNLKAASLAALLQFWDDNLREMKLVVRDYGVLVTTPERAREAGYLPVVDLARALGGSGTPVGERVLEPAPPKRPVPAKHESPRKPKTQSNDPFK